MSQSCREEQPRSCLRAPKWIQLSSVVLRLWRARHIRLRRPHDAVSPRRRGFLLRDELCAEELNHAWRKKLFQLLGIPISVDVSWLVILALLTLSLASAFPAMLHDYFPAAGNEPGRSGYSVIGSGHGRGFLHVHRASRAGACRGGPRQGIPIRGITLFLFGGVAELGDEPPSARSEFLMAIGGPIVTIVLSGLLWLLAIAGYNAGWPHPVVIVLGYLAMINGLVLIFNLVPAFPPARWRPGVASII